MVHSDVENARIGDVLRWLTGSFSLDPEVWSVIIHGLWSRSATHIRWELTRLMRTVAWKDFVEGCRRRGYECVLLVQACPKGVVGGPTDGYRRVGGSSSGAQGVVHEVDAVTYVAEVEEDAVTHVAEAEEEYRTPHAQSSAQADAGEHIDSIVRHMKIDDLTACREEDAVVDVAEAEEEDRTPHTEPTR